MEAIALILWTALAGSVSSRVTYIPQPNNPCNKNPCDLGQCLLDTSVTSLCACPESIYGPRCQYAGKDSTLVSSTSTVTCHNQCEDYNLGRHGEVRCNMSRVIDGGQMCQMDLYSEQSTVKTITECQVIVSLTLELSNTSWSCNPPMDCCADELFRTRVTEVVRLNNSVVSATASRTRHYLKCWQDADVLMRQSYLSYLGSETGWSLNNYTLIIPQQTMQVYLQIDLKSLSIIHQLVIQPRGSDYEEWVTKVKVSYQQENDYHWYYVVNKMGYHQIWDVFPANESFADSPNNVTKEIKFMYPFVADRVRIVVYEYLPDHGPAMRVDLMGCVFNTIYS